MGRMSHFDWGLVIWFAAVITTAFNIHIHNWAFAFISGATVILVTVTLAAQIRR